MKKLMVLLLILALANAIYFIWSKRSELGKFTSPKVEQSNKIPSRKTQIPTVRKDVPTNKTPKFNKIVIKDYTNRLNKTIKAQYKELEECEKEFDFHFGDLLKMNEKKQLEYLNDSNNLEAILDKFSSINFTTPSSAKVIKEFANPLSGQIKITDVYHKPGNQDRVLTCSPGEKMDILNLFYKSKIKKKAIMRGVIEFFENENSTLDYPWILFNQITELKKLLKINGISESKFPKLGTIEREFKAFDEKIKKLLNSYRPRENATWDYEGERLEYDFALKLQADIKSLLRQIKEDII